MPETQAVFYRKSDGSEPVDDFIEGLQIAHQVVIDGQIDLLNGLDPSAPPLPYPHTSQVRGPLRELRCHYGNHLYRILYQRSGNLFVLLHMIQKNKGDIPEQDIIIAQQRMADFKERMDADPRVPPRATGHDAP
ncbi:MAG: type II toxin-antitoxin system RelE/ParE family toxin [Thermomicrobiales bacterium]